MILDWSANYHANNMYQQVAPIEIYVKKVRTIFTSFPSLSSFKLRRYKPFILTETVKAGPFCDLQRSNFKGQFRTICSPSIAFLTETLQAVHSNWDCLSWTILRFATLQFQHVHVSPLQLWHLSDETCALWPHLLPGTAAKTKRNKE